MELKGLGVRLVAYSLMDEPCRLYDLRAFMYAYITSHFCSHLHNDLSL